MYSWLRVFHVMKFTYICSGAILHITNAEKRKSSCPYFMNYGSFCIMKVNVHFNAKHIFVSVSVVSIKDRKSSLLLLEGL